jgi:hypothetical protein
MRISAQILLIVILGFFLELFMPWWCIAIAAFVGGATALSRMNFIAGFLAIGILWTGKAMITNLSTASDLADKVARTFMLHSTAMLLLVTFLLAGLIGGFAAMSGAFLRRMIK